MSEQPEKKQPIDEELEKANRMNAGFVDDDPPAEETPEAKPEEQPKPKEEPEPPAEPEKPEEPEKPKEPSAPGEEGGNKQVEPPARPEKYIPIPQYKDEKKKWETEKADLQRKIDELNKASQKPEGSKAAEDALKAYAEKHKVDEGSVRELVDILRNILPGQQLPQDKLELIEKAAKTAQENQEEAMFSQEFDSRVVPLIKEQYPNATPEQIANAKSKLSELAHTKELHQTPLNYIFAGQAAEMQTFFSAPKGRKTAETGRPAGGAKPPLSAKDFESAKSGELTALFDRLEDMSPEEKGPIVSDLNPVVYDQYVKYLSHQDQGVEVSRDGRRILLK